MEFYMPKLAEFDLIIVYSERSAKSAHLDPTAKAPFSGKSESYNLVYSYFLGVCRRKGLSAAFTTSADIAGPGLCSSYWTHSNSGWKKVSQAARSSLFFDKFTPTDQTLKASRHLLFSEGSVKAFNHPGLFNLFFDKQKAYRKLAKFSIPTVVIGAANRASLATAGRQLSEMIAAHPNREDFSDQVILKDRFGAGGLNIFKQKADQPEKILKGLLRRGRKTFVMQPFVKFDQGYRYQKTSVSTDIRLIYLGGKTVQTYIRMAKPGDYRCNEHQGGRLKYLALSSIPAAVLKMSEKVAQALGHPESLYALDFIISNNGNVYLLEGNTGPGLDWNLKLKENEREAKKLIRLVVDQALQMAQRQRQVQRLEQKAPGAEFPFLLAAA
jgi:glutathione synthase/RimK-type ligase-like ATP-grasp enzyme